MEKRGDAKPAELEFNARPEWLAEVRRFVERAASESRLNQTDLEDLLTAVDEAAANAIRHGSPQDGGNRVHVVCYPTPASLVVEVRDEGRGFAPPPVPAINMPGPDAMGGRGLPLMCALADSVEISSTKQGTTVTLKKAAKA